MSFFKKAIGMFVELDEKPNKASQPQQAEASGTAPTQRFDSSAVPDRFKSKEISATSESTQSTQGAFNEEFFNHLQGQIKDNDLDGADYFEFRQTFEALKQSMADIPALTASYAALKATSPNLTVVKLLETADVYLEVVNQEDADFENQYQANYTTEVVGREYAINEEETKQGELKLKIEAIEAEILASKEKQQTLFTEKVTEQQKLDSVKANWDITVDVVRSNIETDKKNISTYLETKTV